MTSDRSHVDDLFQETYYRFLRANRTYESEEHRRSYLFRIATNLVTDGYRRRAGAPTVQLPPEDDAAVLRTPGDEGERAADRTDLTRAMASLRSRDRALLWLAYGQGASHVEIAGALGLQTSSIKSLLYRARGRLARLLQRDVRSGSARERTRR
jgi:RNA polymerase sigma-70 factor (ECF subfamily)